jgi:cadmium resistance protein CadD (predicted permease)
MAELLTTTFIAVSIFAATNIDDIFILIAFFSNPNFRKKEIILGQFLGMGILTGLSLTLSLIAIVVPANYLRFFGVFPLLLGMFNLWKILNPTTLIDNDDIKLRSRFNVLSVGLVTIANGGDNLGVYVPVFATRSNFEVIIVTSIFLMMTAVWCWASYYFVKHPFWGHTIRKYGSISLPFVLIGLGLLILLGS